MRSCGSASDGNCAGGTGMKISRMADTLGGLSVAAMVYTPAIRGLFGIETIAYVGAIGALCLAACFGPLRRRQTVYLFAYIFIAATFLAWVVFSTALNQLSVPRSTLLLLVSILLIGTICALSWGEKFYSTFLYSVVFCGVMLALFIVYSSVIGGGDFRRVLVGNIGYLILGSLVAIPTSILLPYLLATSGWKRLWVLILLMPLGLGLVVALARGALLFTAIAGVFALVFYWPRQDSRRRKARTGMTTRLLVVGLAIAAGVWFMPARTYILLRRIFSGDESEVGGRGDIWAHAWGEVSASPLMGHGLGHYVQSFYSHPHNMFLQVGMDSGFVGMILIALLMVIPFVGLLINWRRKGNLDPLTIGLLFAFVILFLDAQKSGDFYTARTLFIFSGLMLSHGTMRRVQAVSENRGRANKRRLYSSRPTSTIGGTAVSSS